MENSGLNEVDGELSRKRKSMQGRGTVSTLQEYHSLLHGPPKCKVIIGSLKTQFCENKADLLSNPFIFTDRQRSCGKVIFSQVLVCPQGW